MEAGFDQLLKRAMDCAGVPASDRQDFLNWAVCNEWTRFREERMNKRIMIENRVRNLGLRFPNGTVKKEYYYEFALPTDEISDVELVGAEDTGLHLEQVADGLFALKGRPMNVTDYKLTLRYRTVAGEPASELVVPVAFNPNPRDLWKNIPTNEKVHYYKPDSAKEYVKVASAEGKAPRKNMVAVSQRGRSHAQEGKPRDDHFGLCHCDESDWYILTVADGAGSARYSRKGSEIACETVVDYCRGQLRDNPEFEEAIRAYQADSSEENRTDVTRRLIHILYNGALKAHEAIRDVADANEEVKMRDFATTLMFAICKRYDFGWFIASFWVGDGAMCLYDAETGTAKLLGTPDEGEFSGQTRFLTMREIFHDPDIVARRMRMTIVPDFTALFLMTDGVSDPMFETDLNLRDYSKWEEFAGKLRDGFSDDGISGVTLSDDSEAVADGLLGWLDFWSPGNHDDRTIAILY